MKITTTLPLLLLLTSAGCDKKAGDKPADDAKIAKANSKAEPKAEPKEATPAPLDPRVAKAAEIAKAIDKDPAKADEVLAAKGLDRDGLEALMYEIAKDPKLAASYEQARAE